MIVLVVLLCTLIFMCGWYAGYLYRDIDYEELLNGKDSIIESANKLINSLKETVALQKQQINNYKKLYENSKTLNVLYKGRLDNHDNSGV